MKKFLYTIPVLIMASCNTYEPVSKFQDVTKYSERTEKNSKAIPKGTGILSLNDAIKIGLENNPDYMSTKYAMIIAVERYKQSMSTYYPTLSISHNISNTHYNPHYTRNLTSNQYEETARVSAINSEWLIYDGLMRKMNALAAKCSAKNMAYLNQNSKRLLTLFIINAYNSILLANERIRISNGDLEFNNKMLHDTILKYDAGIATLTDKLNFETKLNNAKNALIASEHSLNTAKFILAELMGLTDGTISKNIKFSKLETKKSNTLLKIEDYLDTALKQRPDLKANRAFFCSAKYKIKSAYGSFYPKVSLNASANYTNDKDEYSGYSTTKDSDENTVGINMSWVIFSGFSRLAKLREAKAFANQQEYKLIEKWLTVVAEVRQSYNNCQKNIKQLEIYQNNLKLSKETRFLIEKEYKAGSTSITRLNEVQRDLITAEGNYSSAIINLKNAYAQLNAAIGGTN